MELLANVFGLIGFFGLVIVLITMGIAKLRGTKELSRKYWISMAGCFGLIVLAYNVSPNEEVQQDRQPTKQVQQAQSSDKPKTQATTNSNTVKVSDTGFTSDVENLLAQQYHVQPEQIDLSISDYWENPEGDDGLINTRGTYKIPDGTKHEFSARFVIETRAPVRLTIDDKRIFWNEELQDATLDAHSKVKK